MITSAQNPRVQWVRRLQTRARERRQEQAFVVEGVRLAEEALEAGWEARWVIYSEDLNPRGQAIIQEFVKRGAAVDLASSSVLASASDTQTPQGILAVMVIQTIPVQTPFNFAFIADGIQDPGNLGTMLRTAAAAGVQAALIPPDTVDPFSPKVVRSAMGAHFRLPIQLLSWEDIAATLQRQRMQLYLASAGSGLPYHQTNFCDPIALLIGSEAEGPSVQARYLPHSDVHIPMPGKTESLNAAVAAGILLFEVVRQRFIQR